MTDKKKQSVYIPEEMLKEIKGEAHRLNRSLSWTIQKAWEITRKKVKEMTNS